jgi:hypothetical protein
LRFTICDLRALWKSNSSSTSTGHDTRANEKSDESLCQPRGKALLRASRQLNRSNVGQTASPQRNFRWRKLPCRYRAKSNSDFINKLRIVEEECDESLFWMELLVDNNMVNASRLSGLMKEAAKSSQSLSHRQKPPAPLVARKSCIVNRKFHVSFM